MKINPRDKKLLELLRRYEVLSSKQIRALVFSKIRETNYFRRMRELEKGKMIRRMGPMLDHSYAWALGRLGKEMYGVFPKEGLRNRLTLEHDVSLSAVRMRLDELGLGKHLITESELRRRAREKRVHYQDPNQPQVVPDALFPVTLNGRAEVFALEVELSLKNRQRYQELFRRYEMTNRIFAIWYVVKTKELGAKLAEEQDRFYRSNRWGYKNKKMMCYSVLEDFLVDPWNAKLFYEKSERRLVDYFQLKEKNPAEKGDHSIDQSVIEKDAFEKTAS